MDVLTLSNELIPLKKHSIILEFYIIHYHIRNNKNKQSYVVGYEFKSKHIHIYHKYKYI